MNAKEYEALLKDPKFYRQTMAAIRRNVREIDKMTKNCQLEAAVIFLDSLENRLRDLREIVDQKMPKLSKKARFDQLREDLIKNGRIVPNRITTKWLETRRRDDLVVWSEYFKLSATLSGKGLDGDRAARIDQYLKATT